MVISTEKEYQEALAKAHELQSKDHSIITREEKLELNNILKAISSYQFRQDPVYAATDIP